MKEYNIGYVASPLNAPTKKEIKKNMAKARKYEAVLNLLSGSRNRAIQGYVPALLDDNIPEEREMGLNMGLELLDKSDAIILCGNKLTNGMYTELKKSITKNKKIFVLKGNPSRYKLVNIFLIKVGIISLEKIPKGKAIAIRYTRRIW